MTADSRLTLLNLCVAESLLLQRPAEPRFALHLGGNFNYNQESLATEARRLYLVTICYNALAREFQKKQAMQKKKGVARIGRYHLSPSKEGLDSGTSGLTPNKSGDGRFSQHPSSQSRRHTNVRSAVLWLFVGNPIETIKGQTGPARVATSGRRGGGGPYTKKAMFPEVEFATQKGSCCL